MEKESITILISALAIILLLGFIFYLNNPLINGFAVSEQKQIIHQQEMPISFEISDPYIIGINVDKNLNFGPVGIGNSATKNINITNPFPIPVKVNINFTDDIYDFIKIPENDFILKTNDIKKVPITITTPANAEFSNHSGYMKVTMTKA